MSLLVCKKKAPIPFSGLLGLKIVIGAEIRMTLSAEIVF